MDKELIEKIELNYIPAKYHKWKTLEYYRKKFNFLPYLLKERICEQLMACDYLLSLELWLKPVSVIYKRHRLIYVQQIASIYEAIIDNFIDKKVQEIFKDEFIKEIVAHKYTQYRTFNTSILLLKKEKIFKETSIDYLLKLSEARNYIHLSKEHKKEILDWIGSESSEDIRKKLDSFISLAENKLK